MFVHPSLGPSVCALGRSFVPHSSLFLSSSPLSTLPPVSASPSAPPPPSCTCQTSSTARTTSSSTSLLPPPPRCPPPPSLPPRPAPPAAQPRCPCATSSATHRRHPHHICPTPASRRLTAAPSRRSSARRRLSPRAPSVRRCRTPSRCMRLILMLPRTPIHKHKHTPNINITITIATSQLPQSVRRRRRHRAQRLCCLRPHHNRCRHSSSNSSRLISCSHRRHRSPPV